MTSRCIVGRCLRGKRRVHALVLLMIALALASAASGSSRATGTLRLDESFAVGWKGVESCPAGTPAGLKCYDFVGRAVVPGLGRVTHTYTKTFDGNFDAVCIRTLRTAVVAIAGKGTLDLSMVGPSCESAPPARSTFQATITGGTGSYAGASGGIRIESRVTASGFGRGIAEDRWTGTLTVAELDFDLAAPILAGASSKTVRAPRKAKQARVRFTVTARDSIDGSVLVTCKPRGGSRFRIGKTTVACSAMDSSGNTGRARFTVTVRPRA